MASINEVYGNDFKQRASLDAALHVVNLYASNIVHKQFNFNNDGRSMWIGNNMKPEIITALVTQVATSNKNFRVKHINKTTKDINMFPYLINGPVEYFIVVDMSAEKTQLYSIYITPVKMDVF